MRGEVMDETLTQTLGSLAVKEAVSHGRLQLSPLVGGTSAEVDLAFLEEALEEGVLRVEELGEAGSVPELRVANGGSRPVLVLEGDEFVGAKQNRVANSSVLVAAGSELVLPVSCVERGRWSRHPPAFSAGAGSPHPSLRRITSRSVHDSLRRRLGHASDQGAVWEEVDRVAALHDAPSPTSAFQDTRAHLAESLAGFEALADELPEGTRGVVVAIGARPMLVEVLAGPRSFSKMARKRLAGYALESLEHREGDAAPDPSAIEGFVRSVATAPQEEYASVGEGTDLRFGSEGLSGYALVRSGSLLHAAAFAT